MIATKFSVNLYLGDPNGGGSSRKAVIAACEQSLRRLRTDYIDLYWLHNWDKHTPIEETMAALNDLVQSGKVRYIGVSDTPAWKVAQAQVTAHFRGVVAVHRPADRVFAAGAHGRGRTDPYGAANSGLGVTPWSPLKGGLLSGKFTRGERGRRQARPRLDEPNGSTTRPMGSSRRWRASPANSIRLSRASRSLGCKRGRA